jgi:hypothetical protein
MKINSLCYLIAIIFLLSCTKENPVKVSDYSKGVFVVNQGAFQNGTGSITYQNGSDTIQNLFEKVNPGKVLGNIAQAMIKFDNKYFITINNGAKIQVVDASTFISKGEIGGISGSRYFATDGKKLYVSAWGSDLKSGAIYEINPTNLTLSAPIVTSGAPETMLIANGKLYVTMSTVIEKSKSLAIINTATNKLETKLDVSDNPTSIAIDKNKAIWVLCGGNSDWAMPALSTKGALVMIENNVVSKKFVLSNGANGLEMDNNGDRMYFLMDGKVYVHDISDQLFEKESIYDGNFSAIGYQKSTGMIYLADAGNYTTDGVATFIHPITKFTGKFKTGLIPGFFYFSE